MFTYVNICEHILRKSARLSFLFKTEKMVTWWGTHSEMSGASASKLFHESGSTPVCGGWKGPATGDAPFDMHG
jgi:hypothetical protein